MQKTVLLMLTSFYVLRYTTIVWVPRQLVSYKATFGTQFHGYIF